MIELWTKPAFYILMNASKLSFLMMSVICMYRVSLL